MSVEFTNNACTTLFTAADATQTTLKIGVEGVFFPQLTGAGEYFYATITGATGAADENQLPEIVKVTSITHNGTEYDVVVERGAGIDGAAGKAWLGLSNFQLLVTSELLYDLKNDASAEANTYAWILNSDTLVNTSTVTLTLAENGHLFGVTTNGLVDTVLTLPAIPAPDPTSPGGLDDIRYMVVNRTMNGSGSKVTISADRGQTINNFNSISLTQNHSAVVLHAKRGATFWDAQLSQYIPEPPDDGQTYGITYGPTLVSVVENPPNDGNVYVRNYNTWVEGVEEAPKDGTPYQRQDGTWVSPVPTYTPLLIAMSVDLAGSQAMGVNTWADIRYNRVIHDPMGYHNGAGGFVAPVKGLYRYNASGNAATFNQGAGWGIAIAVDNVIRRFIADTDSAKNTNDVWTHGSGHVLLDAGEVLTVKYRVEESGRVIHTGAFFDVEIIYQTDANGMPVTN